MLKKNTLIFTYFIFAFFLFSLPCLYTLGQGEKDGDLYNDTLTKDLSSLTIDDECIILPESFLRSYDPITIFYKDPIGPASGGPLDTPGDIISITPSLPGEFIWVDARILQFHPAVPWAPLSEYEITTRGVTKQLVTMMIPPNSVSPSSRTNLDPFSRITLSFNERIDSEYLADMITLEIKPLPGIGDQERVQITREDFTIKELEQSGKSSTADYVISLASIVPYGRKAILTLKLSIRPDIPGSAATYIFETKQEFTIKNMGSGSVSYPVATNGSIYSLEQAINCGTRKNPLFIEFSEDIAPPPLSIIKKSFQFTPAVRNLTYNTYGKRIMLYFDADRETPYQLRISHGDIKSRQGRSLALFGESSFYFYYTQLYPYIQWTEGKTIVEQYGPQYFPMKGRAMEKIDLRIYKISPLNLNFWPFPSTPVVVNESEMPPMPGEEPAYGNQIAEQIRLLGTPLISRIIELPIDKSTGSSSFGMNIKPYLEEIAGPSQPGTYLLGYRELEGSAKRYYVKVTVTDLSLSTIEEEHGINFLVTSLRTGEPLSGAHIRLETYKDETWNTLIAGTTNTLGQYYYQHNKELSDKVERIVVTYNHDTLVLDPDNPPPQFMNNHWFGSSGSWFSWLTRKPVEKKDEPVRKGCVLTERPVYKPEETVYILGYVRIWQQGKIRLEEPRNRKIIINGPGRKTWDFPVTLSEYGHFGIEFDKQNVPTGDFTVYLMDTTSGETLAQTSFKKEAYRIPRFEIDLSAPDKTPLDEPFSVTLTADYYAGGRVVDQQITWEVNRYSYQLRPPHFPGYLFSSDERFTSMQAGRSLGQYSVTDMTDANGSATLVVDPSREQSSVPTKYVIHATVRGADVQTVTSSTSVLALPPFVIGLNTGDLIKKNLTITPEIIVIGHDEAPVKGKEIKLRLYQRQWHSYLTESDFTTGEAKYNSDIVDKLIFEKEYVSTLKPLSITIPVSESGVYVIEVSGKDNLGRMQKVFSDCFVTGDTPTVWKKTEAHIFETTLDQSTYSPGEKATLLLKSPFQEAKALIIVEKPIKTEYYWIEVANGQGLFTLPIEKNMIPRLPIHTLLIRGRSSGWEQIPGGDSQQVKFRDDRRKPIAMANTTWLYVEPDEHKAMITLDHAPKTEPGTEVDLTITMTDVRGKPLDGVVSLWLVDRAVLALGKEQFKDPLYSFIGDVNSHIRIRETRNDVVGNLVVEENPGGGGDEDDEIGLIERTSVRRMFRTVPYYNKSIPVYGGTARITISMPDNLTDFDIRAIGISGEDKFGTAKSRISIRLPLIVQSSLPRFVRPFDEFIAGGIGRVVEGEGGSGSYQVRTEGMFIERDGALLSEESGELMWKPLRPQTLFFPFIVPGDTPGLAPTTGTSPDGHVEVTLAVKRDYDNASDGFSLPLPLREDISTHRLDFFSPISTDEIITLPGISEPYREQSVERTLVITTEPAFLSMLNSMQYLSNYAHLCTEQRISKLYPGLALYQLFNSLGLKDMYYPDKLQFDDLIAYLGSCLNDQGLYSFWPGSKGYVYLTAYVVEFLALAKNAGFTFNEDLLTRPINALKQALRSDYSYFISGYVLRERIEALLALGAAGYYDKEYGQDLLVAALNSNMYEKGRILYYFIKNGDRGQKQVGKLLDHVRQRTVFKLDANGRKTFEGLEYSQSTWGGPVLTYEMRSFASILRALYAADPESEDVKLMVDYLLARSDKDGWGNTATNVSVLLTLGEIMGSHSGTKNDLTFSLVTGSQKKTLSMQNKSLILYKDSTGSESTLHLSPPSGLKTGQGIDTPGIFYSVEYLPSGPGSKIKGESSGFVVTRRQLLYDGGNNLRETKEIIAGGTNEYLLEQVVEEHVQVINPEQAYYVAIKVPLASGFEPLNPALATAPREAEPAGRLTRQPSYSMYADDHVTYYFDWLPPGTYDFYFRVKANFTGTFIQPPATCELMYDLSKSGRSNGTEIIIRDPEAGK